MLNLDLIWQYSDENNLPALQQIQCVDLFTASASDYSLNPETDLPWINPVLEVNHQWQTACIKERMQATLDKRKNVCVIALPLLRREAWRQVSGLVIEKRQQLYEKVIRYGEQLFQAHGANFGKEFLCQLGQTAILALAIAHDAAPEIELIEDDLSAFPAVFARYQKDTAVSFAENLADDYYADNDNIRTHVSNWGRRYNVLADRDVDAIDLQEEINSMDATTYFRTVVFCMVRNIEVIQVSIPQPKGLSFIGRINFIRTEYSKIDQDPNVKLASCYELYPKIETPATFELAMLNYWLIRVANFASIPSVLRPFVRLYRKASAREEKIIENLQLAVTRMLDLENPSPVVEYLSFVFPNRPAVFNMSNDAPVPTEEGVSFFESSFVAFLQLDPKHHLTYFLGVYVHLYSDSGNMEWVTHLVTLIIDNVSSEVLNNTAILAEFQQFFPPESDCVDEFSRRLSLSNQA